MQDDDILRGRFHRYPGLPFGVHRHRLSEGSRRTHDAEPALSRAPVMNLTAQCNGGGFKAA